MLGSAHLQRVYEAAEDCVAAGRYTNAAKLLASLLVQDPEPDHERIAAVLDALIEISAEPSALINRAAMLLDPVMGETDPERALALLQDAADQTDDPEHPEHTLSGLAHGMIGDCYIRGAGVSADPDAGFGHYLLAAEYGNAKAAFNVGLAYDQGMLGQAVDRDAAKRFYRIAADGGEAAAMTRLAVLYMTDQDPPDEVTIVDLLEAAVERGDEDAAEILQNLQDDVLE
ncbi:tetratricopeptide repeat protein [Skermanella pratensis]|uniref:tetratricopeptide repeat protein n=1 Tax=Skermanella pratensis TaxID=2233999 RepID=UPI00130178A4|nr:SEL1-like repeat protein [Skermanella pratensis]